MTSQARSHCQHSSVGRTGTQDSLCADSSRGRQCKDTCQSPHSVRTEARPRLLNPQPCCLFPLISGLSLTSLFSGACIEQDSAAKLTMIYVPGIPQERLQTSRLRAEATSGSSQWRKCCLRFCLWTLHSAIIVSNLS